MLLLTLLESQPGASTNTASTQTVEKSVEPRYPLLQG
jgi:hypothetical protein